MRHTDFSHLCCFLIKQNYDSLLHIFQMCKRHIDLSGIRTHAIGVERCTEPLCLSIELYFGASCNTVTTWHVQFVTTSTTWVLGYQNKPSQIQYDVYTGPFHACTSRVHITGIPSEYLQISPAACTKWQKTFITKLQNQLTFSKKRFSLRTFWSVDGTPIKHMPGNMAPNKTANLGCPPSNDEGSMANVTLLLRSPLPI